MEAEVTKSDETEEASYLPWKDRVAHLRRVQGEDGSVPVSVIDWTVTDDEECVELTFRTLHDNSTHTERLTAPTPTNNTSEFEQVLDAAGCTLETADELESDTAKLRAIPTESRGHDELEWSVLGAVEKQQERLEGDYDSPDWATSSVEAEPREKLKWYGLCALFAPAMFPISLYALANDDYAREATADGIAKGIAAAFVGLLVWVAVISAFLFV